MSKIKKSFDDGLKGKIFVCEKCGTEYADEEAVFKDPKAERISCICGKCEPLNDKPARRSRGR
jgi:hypothetical protein